uniref:Ig-like domain-containing protein n=1 Tax=Nothoprocta perdicaria TaxID=30464 RepID=A0A8C6ZAK3_NOTPE
GSVLPFSCTNGALLFALLRDSSSLISRVGQSVKLSCSQMETSHRQMFWYKQPVEKDSKLELVVLALKDVNVQIEKDFSDGRFKSSGIQTEGLSLSIEPASLNDSGIYYCAESETQ